MTHRRRTPRNHGIARQIHRRGQQSAAVGARVTRRWKDDNGYRLSSSRPLDCLTLGRDMHSLSVGRRDVMSLTLPAVDGWGGPALYVKISITTYRPTGEFRRKIRNCQKPARISPLVGRRKSLLLGNDAETLWAKKTKARSSQSRPGRHQRCRSNKMCLSDMGPADRHRAYGGHRGHHKMDGSGRRRRPPRWRRSLCHRRRNRRSWR